MALNPDDLLIFKTREEKEKEEEKKKKEKEEEKKEKAEKPAGAPVAPVNEAAKPPEPSQRSQAEVSFKPVQNQPSEENGNVREEKQFEEELTTKNIAGNELVFYKVAPVETAEEMVSGEAGTQLAPDELKRLAQKKHLSAKDSRRIGEHMTCTWHPWRQAYAICDYCRRPFCYEDIIEHNGLYYCLDDIDKVINIKERELSKYNNFRIIASVALFLMFAVFFYYNYNMMVTLPTRLQNMGLNNYFENIFNPITPQIIEILLIWLSLVVSFAVAADIKKSLQLTLVIGVASILFFSYEYIMTNQLYLGLVAILSFIAIAAMIYSKTSYSSLHVSSEEDIASEVLNASKVTF